MIGIYLDTLKVGCYCPFLPFEFALLELNPPLLLVVVVFAGCRELELVSLLFFLVRLPAVLAPAAVC